jgi:RimJ/RimL family protein N-acetyltransferase
MNGFAKEIIFTTDRLIIRRYCMDDMDDFFRLNGDPEIMQYIRPAQDYECSKEFLQKVIGSYLTSPGLGRWGMISSESMEFIGSFAVIPVDHMNKIQIGYSLLKENWGKGYASEAVKGGIGYAFDQLKLSDLAGITYPENTLSQKVLLRNGFLFDRTFEEEGKELFLYLLQNPENRLGK